MNRLLRACMRYYRTCSHVEWRRLEGWRKCECEVCGKKRLQRVFECRRCYGRRCTGCKDKPAGIKFVRLIDLDEMLDDDMSDEYDVSFERQLMADLAEYGDGYW
ncbi:unnamed protein product [Cercospora beticola]|nr:unnamed protein product [Cercospora beticola]